MTTQNSPQGEHKATVYHLPEGGTHKDWSCNECRDFVPSARQALVIEAVKAALAAGKYYAEDVRAFCAMQLGASADDQQSNGPIRTEGGEFGMDCYYARQYLDARKKFEASARAMARLKPHVGQKLGTIVFNDYKRTTGTVVLVVYAETDAVRISGKRGAQTIEAVATASQIERAIDRAKEKGYRKDDFDQYAPVLEEPLPSQAAVQPELAEVA